MQEQLDFKSIPSSAHRERVPVALFVFNRLDHTRRTIESLKNNVLARDTDLFIFSDARKSESQIKSVAEVRQYIKEIDGFRSVTITERRSNMGLARSIIDGVTTTVNKYDRVIVLEDDMLTSPYFLSFMNDALEKYADESRVISIHGYVYPVEKALPDTFFLPGADCWGWATWKRGWSCFNGDGRFLLDELRRRNLLAAFDFNGSYPYSDMLVGQINGLNDSWAIRWYASAFLANKLTLYPGQSLVHNIGNDNSGTHCGESAEFDARLSQSQINIENIVIEPSQRGLDAFEEFFWQLQQQAGTTRNLARYFRGLLGKARMLLSLRR